MLNWLIGKKTYLLAVAIAVAVVVLVLLGYMTPELAINIAMLALPAFAITFRAALATHQKAMLAVLTDIAQAGVAYRTHNVAGLASSADKLASDVAPLIPFSTLSGTTISFSGAAKDVVQAVSALQLAQPKEAKPTL